MAPRPLSAMYSPLPDHHRRTHGISNNGSSSSSNRRRYSRAPSAPGHRSGSCNGRRPSVAESQAGRRSSSVEADRGRKLLSASKGHGTRVRRWDGNNRTHSDWDSVRRDPELWFPGGDVYVHLYAYGQSRRGPSIRVSVRDLEASDCMLFYQQTLHSNQPDSSSPADNIDTPGYVESSSEDGGFFTTPRTTGKHELYVPAPVDMEREEAFDHHLTTRNFFAWMFDLPLVGVSLGESLIRLHERMNEYRLDHEQNLDDMLAYIDQQGYSDFRDCPDHALAVLSYAERFQLAELWTDAYVHCAGMNDSLISSNEFNDISRTTKALLTRASLEMNVRLERSSVSLANFMEEELGNASKVLPESMAKHMERFRSFLQSYYVQKHGYWPPHNMKPAKCKPVPLAKHTLLTMYTDFRNLYEFIADQDSSPGMQSSLDGIYGSVDIAHAAFAFDKKNKYSPLPHSLPLLPSNIPALESTPKSGSSYFFRFFHSNKKARLGQRTANLNALQEATNAHEAKVMNSTMVKEYTRFEREFTMRGEDEKLSAASARKARWLVVYAQLQTLIDLTRAPEEVRDIEGVEYPLCCQTAGTPPWKSSAVLLQVSSEGPVPVPGTSHPPPLNPGDAASELPSPSVYSARPAPLDLERVATIKRHSLNTVPKLTTTSTPSETPSIGHISSTPLPPPAPPAPPRSTTPSSVFRKMTSNMSTTFLSPRPAPVPQQTASPQSVSRSRPNQKRNLADRLSSSTLGLIFAPQPVRPMAADPDGLLAPSPCGGGEGHDYKFALADKMRPERRWHGPSISRPSSAKDKRKRLSLVESLRAGRLGLVGGNNASDTELAVEESADETVGASGPVSPVIPNSQPVHRMANFPPQDVPLPSDNPSIWPTGELSKAPAVPPRAPSRIITSRMSLSIAAEESQTPDSADNLPALSPGAPPPRAGSDGKSSPSLSEAETPTSDVFRHAGRSRPAEPQIIHVEERSQEEDNVQDDMHVQQEGQMYKQPETKDGSTLDLQRIASGESPRGNAEDLAMRWRGYIGGPFA